MACNYGLLWLIEGLLWGIVACSVRLLGVPGAGFPGRFCIHPRLAFRRGASLLKIDGPQKEARQGDMGEEWPF